VALVELFSDEKLLFMLRHGGAELSHEQVVDLYTFLEDEVLPRLQPGQRMFFDLSITDEPDDGTFFRDDLDKNYSLQYEVLLSVIDFLRTTKAPVKFL
jgi:hypothetical protein